MALSAFMLMGLAACSSSTETLSSDCGCDADAKAYIKVSIQNSTVTRADVDVSGKTVNGTNDENKINNISLYLFSQSSNYSGTFQGVYNMPVTGTETGAQPIKTGSYNAYVIANGSTPMTLSATTSEADFLTAINNTSYTALRTTVPTGGFIMTSRTDNATATESAPYVPVEIKSTNTQTSPASLKVSVERVVGRLEMKSENATNTYDVPSSTAKKATVTLTGYQIANVRNDFYLYRHVATDVTTPTTFTYGNAGINYVIDPKTTFKTSTVPTNYAEWYSNSLNNMAASYTSMGTNTVDYATIGYCNENTMAQDCQKKQYATAVVFEATIEPEPSAIYGATAYILGNDLYYYNGKFYLNPTDLKTDKGIDVSVATPEQMNTLGVKKFTGGKCYYKYFIRHLDNGKASEMGKMEFAIVRNNTYQMLVSSISAFGDPDAKVTPEDPIETSDVYLNVALTVRPWIVRVNDIKF